MTRTSTTRNICCALATTALLTGMSGSAEAKTCWPFGTIIATAGIAIKNDTAKKYARINWRVKVRATATLGMSWDDWGLAEQRDYNCVKKLGTWRCSAVAQPCRS
jgi:hypothetical protein